MPGTHWRSMLTSPSAMRSIREKLGDWRPTGVAEDSQRLQSELQRAA